MSYKKKIFETLMFASIVLFSSYGPIRASIVKVITEKPGDEKALMELIKSGGAMFGGNRLLAIEFTDAKGATKIISLVSGNPKKGIEYLADIRISKNDKYVVISKTAHDPQERNPYALKQSSSTELVWYTENGEEKGSRFFNRTSTLKTVSSDGLATIVVDEGFAPESLRDYYDAPSRETTGNIEDDSDLIDHFLYVLSVKGSMTITRRIKGPNTGPDNIYFSPSGDWFVYTVSGDSFINNLKTGVEEKVSLGTVGWQITDKGELYAWKAEGKRGHWGEHNGKRAWFQEKNVKYQLYFKRHGNPDLVKTDQIYESKGDDYKNIRVLLYDSSGYIKAN